MFQFAGFASQGYGFTLRYLRRGGLPHSEIPGSTPARGFPELIATCYVLHRLSVPRHPPNALLALDLANRHAQRAPHVGFLHHNASRNDTPSETLPPDHVLRRCPARRTSDKFFDLFTMTKSAAGARAPTNCAMSKTRNSPDDGGGGERIRTVDLLLAKQALSQLSYTPRCRSTNLDTKGSTPAEFLIVLA